MVLSFHHSSFIFLLIVTIKPTILLQEGFLIGDVSSEVTNHISDSHSDTARLDTQIVIRAVLPLPSVSLFYLPTGRIQEEVLNELLSSSASEIVGWYKYKRNSSIKPTFRDKLISKGLQKFFEKYHDKKNFVTCNLTNKTSVTGSTHTFTYRFGKINCFNMYEYIEDVTANLGEKLTGYKKAHRCSPYGIFNNIIKESNVQASNTTDAILRIQEAVNVRLREEAQIAAKNETAIRELEAEIRQITAILSDTQAIDLKATQDKMIKEKLYETQLEMARACAQALKGPPESIIDVSNFLMETNNVSDSGNSVQIIPDKPKDRSPSPVLIQTKRPTFNYAAALKKTTQSPADASSSVSSK